MTLCFIIVLLIITMLKLSCFELIPLHNVLHIPYSDTQNRKCVHLLNYDILIYKLVILLSSFALGNPYTIDSEYVAVMYDTIVRTQHNNYNDKTSVRFALSKTPHTWSLRASYGVSFVSYTKKNDRDISRAYCNALFAHWANNVRRLE